MITRLRRALRPADERAAGMTLVELIVAMGIFSAVVAIFMSGYLVMAKNTNKSQVTAQSGDAVRLVFQRLDRQIRYAEAINLPGSGPSGARYVEFRTSARVSATGVATCTQWRWVPDAGALQMRTWQDVATPTVPGWSTVIRNVSAPDPDEASYPFAVEAATDSHPRQQLTLRLHVGNANVGTFVDSETTFVARNSSTDSLSNADLDGNGQSDFPICSVGART